MVPSLGRTVLYILAAHDVAIINQRREALSLPGNRVATGQVYPATIVRCWGAPATEGTAVNLKVHLDGSDDHWVTSTCQGIGAGFWHDPRSVESAASSTASSAQAANEVPVQGSLPGVATGDTASSA